MKGGRFITHMKKLGGIETPLANFFASGVLALDQKLGPILWQLPPNLGFNADRMDAFFRQLPRTTGSAAKIAANHDQRVPDDHALIKAGHPKQRLRHAVEVRHELSYAGVLPAATPAQDRTGGRGQPRSVADHHRDHHDLMYVRLHGHADQLYASGYSDRELDEWAAKINSWTRRLRRLRLL